LAQIGQTQRLAMGRGHHSNAGQAAFGDLGLEDEFQATSSGKALALT
jgi:hypothetical protein